MSAIKSNIERSVALEMVRATEAAARAAAKWRGRGNKIAADGAAVDAMRTMLNTMHIHATVVIGEGEKDEAPMLYEGEVVGSENGRLNGPRLDLAVDPIDGTTITAKGGENAIAVLAAAEEGCFLSAPGAWYMQKLAVGPGVDISRFHLDMSIREILNEYASQTGKLTQNITVCMLDRPRHEALMGEIRAVGACIKLISDGDVAGAIACCMPGSGVDILYGTGGSPEGVITAAALKCLGGDIIGRLVFNNEEEYAKVVAEGKMDPDHTYTRDEMAKGEVIFVATGVTSGAMLKGIHAVKGGETSHSVVMRSATGTVRWLESFHKTV